MELKKISCVIPVKNGEATLELCLQGLRNQTIGREIEIIILDSMSTDKSREIARKYNCIIVDIPEGTFNHGLTRNLGVQYATGDFLFYSVQDAWLSENTMLERMRRHFENEKVMGVCGHQAVPHEKDKNPMLWYRRYSEPKVQLRAIKNVEQFKNGSHTFQRSLIAWDDVVAMYRKTALLELPFAETQFAEDWIWSHDAMMKGWSLVYDPSLVIYHYHHAGYSYAYKAAYAVNYHLYKFFHFKPGIPNLIMPTFRIIYHLGKHRHLTIKEKLYWMCHNFMGKLGVFNSHVNFLLHEYIGGSDSIDKRYNKVCKTIPQGELKLKPS